MRPYFGSKVRDHMFQVINQDLFFDLQRSVHEALMRNEPRIRDVEVEVFRSGDTGEVHIRVGYTVRSTNSRLNQVFPFYLIDG